MTKQNIKPARQHKLSHITNNRYLTAVALLLLGIGIGLISMMLGAAYFGMPMFFAYFGSPMIVLLNLLPPLIILFLAYLVGGRAWIAFLISSFIVLALSVIDFFKVQVRSEPLVITDFALTEEVGTVTAGYVLPFNWKIIVAVVFILIGTVMSAVFLKYKPGGRTRLFSSAVIVIISAIAYVTLYTSDKIYQKNEAAYSINIWSDSEKSIARGFVYPFIYNIHDKSSNPPEGYKTGKAAEMLASYAHDDIPDEKKVNIISVMLESYSDLSQLGVIEFKQDVYGPLHALQAESVYGSLVTNTFAGGTTNSERSYLTGFTCLGDFQTMSNSYVWYLKSQGYSTEGFHAGHDWYYDRVNVNKNLGFDSYYFLEDYDTEDRSDEYFFSKVFELFNARGDGMPYFSYNLSFQNHGPYDSEIECPTSYIEQNGLKKSSFNILNNYLDGIADTTERLADFIGNFRELDTPVVIVIFGDHMPWLGNSYVVYHELGVNIDLSTEEGFYNFYSTPYLIWANDAAKEVLGNDFSGYGGKFSPCFLMNKVFELCSWEGNSFMKASNELRETVDVVSSDGYFTENGVLNTELSGNTRGIYKSYEIIEYYCQHNFIN